MMRFAAAIALVFLSISGCTNPGKDSSGGSVEEAKRQVESVIVRYTQLLSEGYRSLNMNRMAEVTTKEQALKLYHHMSAIGEGKLKMDSSMKDIKFKKIDFPGPDDALVETEERWDFTHYQIDSGKKYAEEKDFIYLMGYTVHRAEGRWTITRVTVINGTSTNTVIPWPEIERVGSAGHPGMPR